MLFSGQHMLTATEPFRQLLAGIDFHGRIVLEVGVGTGVITQMVLDRGPERVIGYEIDPTLCQLSSAALELHIGDFREVTLPPLDARHGLVAAPPYDLLDLLVPLVSGPHAPIHDAILMISEKHFSLFPEFELAFTLAPTDFRPPTRPTSHLVIRKGFRSPTR